MMLIKVLIKIKIVSKIMKDNNIKHDQTIYQSTKICKMCNTFFMIKQHRKSRYRKMKVLTCEITAIGVTPREDATLCSTK